MELSIWIKRGIVSYFKASWSASVFESGRTWCCILCDHSIKFATISQARLAMITSSLSHYGSMPINDSRCLGMRSMMDRTAAYAQSSFEHDGHKGNWRGTMALMSRHTWVVSIIERAMPAMAAAGFVLSPPTILWCARTSWMTSRWAVFLQSLWWDYFLPVLDVDLHSCEQLAEPQGLERGWDVGVRDFCNSMR